MNARRRVDDLGDVHIDTMLASAIACCRPKPYCSPIRSSIPSSACGYASLRSWLNPKVIQPAGV
ncbi:MAG: hypothetical protein U0703_17775 [Anaerolineae bacterium]